MAAGVAVIGITINATVQELTEGRLRLPLMFIYSAINLAAFSGTLHRIVVVGGGAGGLELVTRLGNRFGRRGRAAVSLVECARTHIWKPLLHGVAAGSLDPGREQAP